MVKLNAIKIKEGFEQFNEVVMSGDIDLVSSIDIAMKSYGFTEQQLENFNGHYLVKEAVNKRPHIQRWQLNRFWFIQLVSLEIPTIEMRSYLVLDGTEEAWLELIIRHILPFAKQHNLQLSF